MASFFYQLPQWFDRIPIQQEVERMWTELNIGEENRFALVHRSPELDKQDVIGDAKSKKDWPIGGRQSDFRYFNGRYLDGPTHRLYQWLKAEVPTLARLRVVRLRPSRCYSFHNDEELRFHFAVTTNPYCMFVVSEHGRDANNKPVYPSAPCELPELHTFRIPADGKLYALDTNHPHTAFNGGTTERTHLLFETVTPLNDRPRQ